MGIWASRVKLRFLKCVIVMTRSSSMSCSLTSGREVGTIHRL